MEQRQGRLAACIVGIMIAAALCLPAIKSFTRPSQETVENRVLAPWPVSPRSTADLLNYTRRLEPWINDHFGFRTVLIKLNNKLRHALFGQFPTIQVISGQNQRLFLASHSTTPSTEYSAITIPCGYTPTSPEKVAGQLNGLHESFRNEGVDARIMIVPSAPVIYPEALPAWLAARCAAAASPIELTLAAPNLHAETRQAIYFPKAEMLALKERVPVFPKTWYHWAGAGPREISGLSVEYFWNIPGHQGRAIAESSIRTPSDISHLFPGVNLSNTIEHPDHLRSAINACLGPQCFPSLGSVADKLHDVAYYRNPAAAQRRLIILSDSFGQFIAGWYARYFQEVMHFSTNALGQLDAEEIQQFMAYLKQQAQTGRLLLLFHDGSVLWDRPAQVQEKLFARNSGAVPPTK